MTITRLFSRALSEAKWWFLYRTFYRYHIVRCHGLKPGYYEVEDQMMHAMFGLLVDFVELQSAHMHWACSDENTRWNRFKNSLRLRDWRSREKGMAHLDWEISLVFDEHMGVPLGDVDYGKPTPQASSAKETKDLYLWWIDERPKRPDPMDASGATEAHARMKEDPEGFHRAAVLSGEIEEQQHSEDEIMMKRLVAVRRSLWT